MLFAKNTVLLLCVLPLLVIGLQVFLSMQENKWFGLILPVICALLSLSVPLNMAVLPGQAWQEVLPSIILSTLYANIPLRCCWPFMQPAASAAANAASWKR